MWTQCLLSRWFFPLVFDTYIFYGYCLLHIVKFPHQVCIFCSNSSFQFPGFCMPRMLKNGDEGSDHDSDGSFEAVTPEHNTPKSPQQGKTSTMGKHCHILQDVDGELEMEDITPEVEMISMEKSQKFEQQFFPSVHGARPPPPVLPPSPQSISPLPPTPPSLPPLPPLPTSTMSDCHVDGLHQNCHANAQVILSQLLFWFLSRARTLMLLTACPVCMVVWFIGMECIPSHIFHVIVFCPHVIPLYQLFFRRAEESI